MSTRGIPTRSKGPPAKRGSAVASVRPADPATGSLAKPLRLPTPTPEPTNGDPVFDPKRFLANPGLGKKLIKLKKNEAAFVQGDASDAIFYVQKGKLRVTVTSATGKEATITLVGEGEFLGEDCMLSAHPLRLSTATAMTDGALLRISKAEMVRVLHEEPELSEMFTSFLLARNATMPAVIGLPPKRQYRNEKATRLLCRIAQCVISQDGKLRRRHFCRQTLFQLQDSAPLRRIS